MKLECGGIVAINVSLAAADADKYVRKYAEVCT